MNPYGAPTNAPNRIIVHCMAEFLWIGNKPMQAAEFIATQKLSVHSFITSYGGNIREREDNQGAYHAKGHNTNTLGIEFLVPGIHTYETFLKAIERPYLTDQAYATGKHQIMEWLSKYDIKTVERHSDVDPKRKHDPGSGFPWEQLLEDLGL